MTVNYSREEIFEAIYSSNHWAGQESRSGSGSDHAQTVNVKKFLSNVIGEYNIASMLDIPCGDFNWMQDVQLPKCLDYTGADVVGRIITDNQDKYPDVRFVKMDIVSDPLPKGLDLIFVRDLLGHLSHHDTVLAVQNIRSARPRYLIATTFPGVEVNPHIKTGQWRPINLEHYGLKPILTFDEGLVNDHGDHVGKSLGFYIL